MPFVPVKNPSFFDVSQWGKWWETGAKELEKSTPGKLITAPIRLPAAIVSTTQKAIEQVPKALDAVTKAVPLIAISALVLGAGFLVYKFSKGKKEVS
jgi:hypothetical protein